MNHSQAQKSRAQLSQNNKTSTSPVFIGNHTIVNGPADITVALDTTVISAGQ